ncbi:MAG TPA: hypothetical protein VFK90_01960 [Anaeromyxobacter sp.]|nr:hypothetical protein [Anaeromyxobacter sp.]
MSSPSPSDPSANVPPEEAAWAEVLLAWDDEARHRAYLDRFPDLEGLAIAGRRYREALAARPEDPVAARFRDEVVKRAMVRGLVALPRTPPPERRRSAFARAAAVVFAAVLGATAWWAFHSLGSLGAPP